MASHRKLIQAEIIKDFLPKMRLFDGHQVVEIKKLWNAPDGVHIVLQEMHDYSASEVRPPVSEFVIEIREKI